MPESFGDGRDRRYEIKNVTAIAEVLRREPELVEELGERRREVLLNGRAHAEWCIPKKQSGTIVLTWDHSGYDTAGMTLLKYGEMQHNSNEVAALFAASFSQTGRKLRRDAAHRFITTLERLNPDASGGVIFAQPDVHPDSRVEHFLWTVAAAVPRGMALLVYTAEGRWKVVGSGDLSSDVTINEGGEIVERIHQQEPSASGGAVWIEISYAGMVHLRLITNAGDAQVEAAQTVFVRPDSLLDEVETGEVLGAKGAQVNFLLHAANTDRIPDVIAAAPAVADLKLRGTVHDEQGRK